VSSIETSARSADSLHCFKRVVSVKVISVISVRENQDYNFRRGID